MSLVFFARGSCRRTCSSHPASPLACAAVRRVAAAFAGYLCASFGVPLYRLPGAVRCLPGALYRTCLLYCTGRHRRQLLLYCCSPSPWYGGCLPLLPAAFVVFTEGRDSVVVSLRTPGRCLPSCYACTFWGLLRLVVVPLCASWVTCSSACLCNMCMPFAGCLTCYVL